MSITIPKESEAILVHAYGGNEGRLAVHVSETLPLADAAKAHAQSESGHTRGKIVLLPSG